MTDRPRPARRRRTPPPPRGKREQPASRRGDRRLADVLEWAWQHGAKFDSWSEYFDYQRWMDALEACGLDGDFYAHRERPRSEVFPWCRIDPMVTPAFLWHERELCYQSQTTPDCRTRCSGCGANRLLKGGVCNG